MPIGACFLYYDVILRCRKAEVSAACNGCYFEGKCDSFNRYMFCIARDYDGKVVDVIYIKE